MLQGIELRGGAHQQQGILEGIPVPNGTEDRNCRQDRDRQRQDDLQENLEGGKEESNKEEEDAVLPLPALETLISKIIMENGIDGSAMDIGELGSRITKFDPSFDIRNYGYTKFSKFLDNFF